MLDSLRQNLSNLPRLWKRIILIGFDVFALSGVVILSYSLRYGTWILPQTLDQLGIVLSAPLIALPVFIRMGLYRAVIRYLPERALWTIVQAMLISAVAWVVLIFVLELAGRGVVPRSIPFIYWLFGTIVISASRFAAKRFLGQGAVVGRHERPVIIYGAGEAGARLALALRREANQYVVGFLDDNPGIQGQDVAGIRVYAPSQLPSLVAEYDVRDVILSVPSMPAAERTSLVAKVGGHGIKIRTLPPIGDLVQGKYVVNQIREIDIDELLGRSSVPPDPELLRTMIEARTIMVTGAGGSIGSELCRLIAKGGPQRLVLFEANEFALYRIEQELAAIPELAIVPVLGSITDAACVSQALKMHNVEVVFHAAAHKHVPLVEANALEGIRNNVVGTKVLANAAFEHGVSSFVLISSDKAVRPTNVMGATKRWAELIVHQKAVEASLKGTGQRFAAVRFGNVLGSNGSVVPLFKEQIGKGGPVTLTDAAMTRYFMSIHEAAELIVQAAALSEGNDVFLLEMGTPVLIRDLAENLIRLAGFSVRDAQNPNGDIEIVVTGKRPGEKMYEELFYDEANASVTRHPKILRGTNSDTGKLDVAQALQQLEIALQQYDEPLARQILFSFIQ